jgi:hypothetical protein
LACRPNRDVSRQRINLPAQHPVTVNVWGTSLQVAGYNMSQSPPATDVEGQQQPVSIPAADLNQPSPDEHEQQDMSRGPDDHGDHGLGGYPLQTVCLRFPSISGQAECNLLWLCTPLLHYLHAHWTMVMPSPFPLPIYSPIARLYISNCRIRAASASPRSAALNFYDSAELNHQNVFCIPSAAGSITATATAAAAAASPDQQH